MLDIHYTVENPNDTSEDGNLVVEFGDATDRSKIVRLTHMLCSIYMKLILANRIDLAASYRIRCLSEEMQSYIVALTKDMVEEDEDGTKSAR